MAGLWLHQRGPALCARVPRKGEAETDICRWRRCRAAVDDGVQKCGAGEDASVPALDADAFHSESREGNVETVGIPDSRFQIPDFRFHPKVRCSKSMTRLITLG